jgi:hypothetical protein
MGARGAYTPKPPVSGSGRGDLTFKNFLAFAGSSHTLLLRGWSAVEPAGVQTNDRFVYT